MRYSGLLFLLLSALGAWAGAPVASFTENKGQWPAQVLYRVLLPNGALFVEDQAFTYVLQSGGETHHHGTESAHHEHEPYREHAFRVHFIGGRATLWSGGTKQPHYENYFLGNDPAHWGTGCGVFGEVLLHEVWPGIDLRLDGSSGLKYEFILAPGADPAMIQLRYEGHEHLSIKDGKLVVETTAGDVVEEAPISFYGDDPLRSPVEAHFEVHGDELAFRFPSGVQSSRPFVIDPTITFASYSGSTANNFGFTATYDDGGHLYGAGIVFQQGYPTTLGAFDNTFNGVIGGSTATVDVGVTKWSPNGSSLVWSTYLGGSSNEAPHSMVVNDDDELYIFGHTGSFNFPTTPGCFNNSFSGGPELTYTIGYGFNQPNGTDMFVTHFNATATALIGSTLMGGTENDGVNNDPALAHNYGDSFRGEIIVNDQGQPIIASTTSSPNLPTTSAPQASYNGGTQDGFVFRMDATLTNLLWGTYIGGSGTDAAYGVQVGLAGDVFVTGGTTSNDLPMSGSPLRNTLAGGTDGYVMRYAPNGTSLASTYIGTPEYDQCYFVQLDTDDAVYVVGQSHGPYPISPGRYNVPGSSQFIHKISHELDASLWSTIFGNGTVDQDLSPTAFLVSNCDQIYFSGWGGNTNAFAGNLNSTSSGMSVTADAFQATTDGNDFYLMVLDPEAVGLNYATYFGGSESSEHVDGGTSRFDKKGNIYQAVCAGCQNNDDFPTTPGAWSNNNASTGCNLGVIKFNLLATIAIIDILGPDTVCAPATVQFTNSSVGGDTYLWDFGDGNTSTLAAPSHTYTEPGNYTVRMHLSDSYVCALPDSTTLTVVVVTAPPVDVDPIAPICPGSTVQASVNEGLAWAWSPAAGVSDPTVPDPLLSPTETTEYTVVVTLNCGTVTTSVVVELLEPTGSAGPDRAICAGESTLLDGSGGGTYLWEPAASLSDATLEDPLASPLDSTVYHVAITTPDGCLVHDTVVVVVDAGLPIPSLNDTTICEGGTATFSAPQGRQHLWLNTPGLQDLEQPSQVVSPPSSTWYLVDVTNLCGTIRDSIHVEIRVPFSEAWPDSIVCRGKDVPLFATPGASHLWSPITGLSANNIANPTATVNAPITYTVLVTDDIGCLSSAQVSLDIHPINPVIAFWDAVIDLGQTVQLFAEGNGTFSWSPGTTLNDSTSASPIAEPDVATTYTVSMTDANGCITTDDVTIIIPGSLFIPNTFTPNGDSYNDFFGAWGVDIVEIELDVFDRWGKLIWTTTNMNTRWDGTYGGQDAPIDTYVWKVRAKEIAGGEFNRIGHVTLVR